ncbi:pyruvate decarboxylase [Scheffersomyces coipomensis]|uniref:pyruvate decarboxylase n=1 Tax=Scheffersomyces coipomensis TaxID=1788519 RepID=UPI00315DA278
MAPVKEELSSGSITPTLPDSIPLGEYLFLRILQSNPKLKSIFGIPGDFNVDLLEHLYTDSITNQKVKFIGLCNELNSAYVVDGYSRIIQGLTVLITTFGVGELSALNGIAGSFAEYSPILHIVGTTSLKQSSQAHDGVYDVDVKNHHHLIQSKNSLNHANHDVYKQMAEPVSVIQQSLDENLSTNLDKIDKVLTTIIQERRPGYLYIPCDITNMLVPTQRLFETPLKTNYSMTSKSIEVMDDVVDTILDKLYKSTNPSIFGDCLVSRFGLDDKFNQFITSLPSNLVKLFSSNLSRSIDEDLPNYLGLYFANGSSSAIIKHEFELNTDVLLNFGFFNSETTTGGYHWDLTHIHDYIEIHPDYIKINGKLIMIKDFTTNDRLFSMGDLLDELLKRLDTTKFININRDNIGHKKFYPETQCIPPTDDLYIPQTKLIDHLNQNLQPNDVLIMDTMSFSFALPDIKFPSGVKMVTQNYYGSIGYALPSTFGVTMAINDLELYDRRIILIEGDGAAQMTIQELSTFVKYHEYIKNYPKIFLINNDGYTIERMIKGPTRSYNDINGQWDWSNILKVYGDPHEKYHKGYKLHNLKEFNQFFKGQQNYGTRFDNSKLEFFELTMGKFDAPERFRSLFLNK